MKLKDIVSGVKYRVVDFPQYDEAGKAVAQIGIRLLTEGDQEWIISQSTKDTNKQMTADGNTDTKAATYNSLYNLTFNKIASRYTLLKCTYDPDTEPNKFPFFTTVNEIKSLLPGQVEYLHLKYKDLESGNPYLTNMTNEEMEALIETCHKDMIEGANFLEQRLHPQSNLRTAFDICINVGIMEISPSGGWAATDAEILIYYALGRAIKTSKE